MTGDILGLLTLLAAGHFLADFGLQSDFVARNKIRALSTAMGFFAMTAHAAIHGLIAAVIVSWQGYEAFWPVAFASVLLTHWLVDLGKCRRMYGIVADQVFHLIALAVVTVLIVMGV